MNNLRNFIKAPGIIETNVKRSTGSANAYVLAAEPPVAAYYDGMVIEFFANFTNTGAATVNAGPGAIALRKGVTTVLASGDIQNGQFVRAVYDSGNAVFQVSSGINGVSGTSGVNGTSGTSGVNGVNGTSGVNGSNGTSGINGTSGVSGANGTSGISGTSGTSGVNGANGTSGINGANGTSGTSGVNGANGTSGVNGASGTSGFNGTSGVSGTSGARGQFGGDSVPYTYSTTTTDSDPSAGWMRFNAASPYTATTYLYVSKNCGTGADISTWLSALDDIIATSRGRLRVASVATPGAACIFNITGEVTLDAGGTYYKIPVTHVQNLGSSLSASESVFISFQPSGSTGVAQTQLHIGRVPMYDYYDATQVDTIETLPKNGAMASATISKYGNFDRFAVTGGDSTSWFSLDRQITMARYTMSIKIKINSLGTTPLLGVANQWPGSTYSNFSNPQLLSYVNLSTGGLSMNNTGTQTSSTGWLSGAVAGDIIELVIDSTHLLLRRMWVRKQGVNGEVNMMTTTKTSTNDGDIFHSIPAIIMADGNYTLLGIKIDFTGPRNPKVCIVGDSMSVGVKIPQTDSIESKLKNKLAYPVASVGAGSTLMKGMLAAVYQILEIRTDWIVLFNYLDPCFYDKANPSNGNYSTWTADFARYVATMKQQGCRFIFVYPQTWAVLDPSGAMCARYETFLNANYASDQKIKVMSADSYYDTTNFHYTGVTNEIIAAAINTIINANP